MKIPRDDMKRLILYQELVQQCTMSRNERMARYTQNRAWYLYGSNGDIVSPWNKIYSHLDLVTSFLYASDSTRFSVNLHTRAPHADIPMAGPFGKRINEEWKATSADLTMQNAILWALVYDSTLVKHIRRRGKCLTFCVDPGSFGVLREDVPLLDRQDAFVHIYYITRDELERNLVFHPRRKEIMASVTDTTGQKTIASDSPTLINNIVMASMADYPDGMGSLTGTANMNLNNPPNYTANVEVPLVEMQELWVWNDDIDDYQTVTMANGTTVIYDRLNIFMPRIPKLWDAEQPFVQICPNPLYDYFWGVAEVARLAPLQQKRNDRMDDIQKLLRKQVDPPTAWFGTGLPDEKVNGFNVPGTQIAGFDPATKFQQFVPQIPNDVYADVRQIDQEFDEQSGLTQVTQGRGESGVRSAGHAGKLLTVGTARPKKRALIIEDSLEQSATLIGRSIYLDDPSILHTEKGEPFTAAQMSPHWNVEVDAHSNSPVFMEDHRDNATILFKARAMTRERLIQIIMPGQANQLITELNEDIIPAERRAAEAEAAEKRAEIEAKTGPKLTAVK